MVVLVWKEQRDGKPVWTTTAHFATLGQVLKVIERTQHGERNSLEPLADQPEMLGQPAAPLHRPRQPEEPQPQQQQVAPIPAAALAARVAARQQHVSARPVAAIPALGNALAHPAAQPVLPAFGQDFTAAAGRLASLRERQQQARRQDSVICLRGSSSATQVPSIEAAGKASGIDRNSQSDLFEDHFFFGIYKTKRYIDTLGVHSWEPPGTSRYAQHQR